MHLAPAPRILRKSGSLAAITKLRRLKRGLGCQPATVEDVMLRSVCVLIATAVAFGVNGAESTKPAKPLKPLQVKSVAQLARYLRLHTPLYFNATTANTTSGLPGVATPTAGSVAGTNTGSGAQFSSTNVQVPGVDE